MSKKRPTGQQSAAREGTVCRGTDSGQVRITGVDVFGRTSASIGTDLSLSTILVEKHIEGFGGPVAHTRLAAA